MGCFKFQTIATGLKKPFSLTEFQSVLIIPTHSLVRMEEFSENDAAAPIKSNQIKSNQLETAQKT